MGAARASRKANITVKGLTNSETDSKATVMKLERLSVSLPCVYLYMCNRFVPRHRLNEPSLRFGGPALMSFKVNTAKAVVVLVEDVN